MVYLLHFEKPISSQHTSQHYLGFSEDLDKRLAEHSSGQGARFCQVAHERGIEFILARTWEGDRKLERKLKNWHNHKDLCPICKGEKV